VSRVSMPQSQSSTSEYDFAGLPEDWTVLSKRPAGSPKTKGNPEPRGLVAVSLVCGTSPHAKLSDSRLCAGSFKKRFEGQAFATSIFFIRPALAVDQGPDLVPGHSRDMMGPSSNPGRIGAAIRLGTIMDRSALGGFWGLGRAWGKPPP